MKTRLSLATAVCFVTLLVLIAGPPISAQEPVLPIAPPDAEAGLSIFADRCAVCHGPLGAGDGQQALTAGLQPPDFTDPAFHLKADPQRMFDIITNGSMINGMPPFGPASSNPLSEGARWDLIAAIYSFGVSPAALAQGETLFTDLGGDLGRLPGLDAWFTQTNEAALAGLENGDWGVDVVGLAEAERLALVDYGRAQSYFYANPLAAFEPIEAATITGLVVNGSTSSEVSSAEVLLRAFNTNFEQTLTLTTTVGADGRYTFNLENVLPEWIYLASTEYNDLAFNSNPDQLNRTQPELNLPVIVYDSTSDPGVVSIAQIHMILNFVPGAVQVSELYSFNNSANAVFVGSSANFSEGVLEISLPAGAENVNFQRAFGSLENFAPATEIIQTETGWADTIPLRPGDGSSNLLVSYQLPYENGLRLAHPLAYPTSAATIIVPDSGVTVQGEGWVNQGGRTLPGGTFNSYANSDLAGANALSLQLEGRPRQLSDTQGNMMVARNDTQELVVGAVALGLALALAALFVQQWRAGTAVPSIDPQAVLQAIAELDDAYEEGRISQSQYRQQRDQLKEEVTALWTTQP